MNKWKAFAIIFTLLSLGSLKETFRIITSDTPDIAPNRTGLIIMAIMMTGIFVFFTIRFWKKASDKRLY